MFYEAERRGAPPLALSLAFGADGSAREIAAPPRAALPAQRLGPRRARRAATAPRALLSSLEDAPFYARARIAHRLDGEEAVSIHEALDLDRFASPIVKAMLPFRMPRALY